MSNNLNNILNNFENSDHIIALSESESFTASKFIHDCKTLITKIKTQKETEFILSCKNSYLFTISFFALLHENKKICLPLGMEKGCIDELKTDRAIVSDFYSDALHPLQKHEIANVDLKSIPDGQISLFTSGSTGERKEIKKRLAHFSSEINILSQTWKVSENSLAVSSVSHQHIYGLLFKILWPLLHKSPFYIDECLYENQLNRVIKQHPHSHLISCPAHLDAMVKFPSNGFLKGKTIFSSGAPLSLQTSEAIEKISGKAPIEVFGSTETGGIAWRKQTASAHWITLSTVEIKADESGTLWVKSAFCEEQNEWYETGDKADITSDKNFKHLGRKDSIAKVSGKRVSLNEMADRLASSEYISKCNVLVLQEKGQTKRESTAAIAVLSEKGKAELENLGRRKFSLKLKETLKHFYTPVLIPRFWRYIDEFPRNSQGKIQSSTLRLFFAGYDDQEKRFPRLRAILQSKESCILKFTIPKDCSFFEGHFNGLPILPGVAQIFWVQFYCEKLAGLTNIKTINKLKFQRIIQPEEECLLKLDIGNNTVNFQFTVDEKICSSGSLRYD